MKKKLVILLTLIVAMCMFVACGEETGIKESQESKSEESKVDEVEAEPVNPEDYVTLGEYKEIIVEMSPVVVEDSEVEQNIQSVLNANAEKVEITDRVIQNGDIVNIDFEGKLDGVPFDGGASAEGGHDLEIGSKSFIEGFEEALVGVASGETKDLELQFPDPYTNNPELSGADVVFTTTVNSIANYVVPELTEELLVTISPETKTIEEYKQSIHNKILESKTLQYKDAVSEKAFRQIVESSKISDPPESMVDEFAQRTITMFESYANASQQTLEEFITMSLQQTMEDFEKENIEVATLSAKDNLVFMAIAKAEGINPTDEDITNFAETEFAAAGAPSVEEYVEQVGKSVIENFLMAMNVYDYLGEKAKVIEVDETEEVETETTETETAETKAEETDVVETETEE